MSLAHLAAIASSWVPRLAGLSRGAAAVASRTGSLVGPAIKAEKSAAGAARVATAGKEASKRATRVRGRDSGKGLFKFRALDSQRRAGGEAASSAPGYRSPAADVGQRAANRESSSRQGYLSGLNRLGENVRSLVRTQISAVRRMGERGPDPMQAMQESRRRDSVALHGKILGNAYADDNDAADAQSAAQTRELETNQRQEFTRGLMRFGLAIHAGVLGMAVVPISAKKFADAIEQTQERLRRFNGTIAQGYASLERDRSLREFSTGLATQQSTRELLNELSRFEEDVRPLKDLIQNKFNELGSILLLVSQGVLDYLKTLPFVGEKLEEMIKKQEELLNQNKKNATQPPAYQFINDLAAGKYDRTPRGIRPGNLAGEGLTRTEIERRKKLGL